MVGTIDWYLVKNYVCLRAYFKIDCNNLVKTHTRPEKKCVATRLFTSHTTIQYIIGVNSSVSDHGYQTLNT